MTTVDPVRVAHLVRAAVLDHYPPQRACIETIRCAVEVGRYFGVTVEPVPVAVIYSTPDWWAADDKANAPGWSTGTPGTGRADSATNTWDGHLMGYVPTAGVLIDYAADQYSRPAKGLIIDRPVSLTISRAVLRAGAALRDAEGGLVVYVREIEDDNWRRGGGWRGRPAVARRAAGHAIRTVRAAYANGGNR